MLRSFPTRALVGLLVPILIALPAAARPGSPATGAPTDELATLAGWMTGSFSSTAQAASDSAYFDIRLEMVPIWTERDDGPWLYVEQAAASRLDRPYRQRVYRLLPDGDAIRSRVFSMPEPLRFAGTWRDAGLLAELTPDSLEIRAGCDVVLRRSAPAEFAGSTEGTGCSSGLRGASWATSEVTVRADRIESWDRGFDGEGEQVWGAEKGPYVFLRVAPEKGKP